MPEANSNVSQDQPPESSDAKSKVNEETESVIKLQVGDTLQIELVSEQGQSQQRHMVKLIGYVPGRSILVTTPAIGNKVLLIRVGQTVNVRFMATLNLIGFKASVLRTVFTPYPYLHLSYPQKFSSVELRRTQRVTVHIVAGIQNERGSNNEPVPAAIIDISVGGAMIESLLPLGIIGDNLIISLRLSVAQFKKYLPMPAVIRSAQTVESTKESATATLYHYGVEFTKMPPEASLVLHGFVYEQIVNSLTGIN